jgi:hypothetical protein
VKERWRGGDPDQCQEQEIREGEQESIPNPLQKPTGRAPPSPTPRTRTTTREHPRGARGNKAKDHGKKKVPLEDPPVTLMLITASKEQNQNKIHSIYPCFDSSFSFWSQSFFFF